MDAERRPNRLIHEKSPYLLQHAYNPVDWYPWGEEAFALARDRNVPVFLSIGYSTCHWCHVMERESFENGSIAAILNRDFVCIKVDREERPDLDRVYMTALQAMGQNGGWPMSMFLTPDRQPFYGGTYYPPESRYGRAGFPDVLSKIRSIWDTERPKVDESARSITTFLEDVANARGPGGVPGVEVLEASYNQISSTYDPVDGGFGAGPKFPRPVLFNFLLRYYARTGGDAPLAMVTHTLLRMASGGMYDQIGGGFHRYAVDGEWRVPHFEKMLYDQAQLVQAYLDASLCSRDPFFPAVARETLDYVLRDMTDPEGGFYSAEDADSPRPERPEESGEGAFYVWTKKEIDDALEGDAQLFSEYFGVEEAGNAPVDPQHEFTGRNILYRRGTVDSTASRFGISPDETLSRLTAAKGKIFNLRAERPRPLRDDKILTSWNGLMIGAFARGFRVLGDERYLVAATRAAEFATGRMWQKGTLLRRYRQGECRIEAHLDDYAFLVSGLLDLFESSGDGRWLERAAMLTEEQIR
ncbi:MAG TPA: thioredoxin domain-containing protein, partial [Bacteroidota bacterium]